MKRKIKVIHVISADMGVRFILLHQLLYLKARGYEVSAVCSPGHWVPEVERAGIPVHTIEIKRKISFRHDLISLWNLFWYFRQAKPDIVHTHTPKAGFVGRLAAKLAGMPIIVHTNPGFYFHEYTPPLKRKINVWLEKLAALCCDSILSQNGEDVVTAIEEGICGPGKIKRLGNGIDLTRFNPERIKPGDSSVKKRELGIAEGEKVVGIVGRLVREKGFLEFFEAARVIKERAPNTRFLAVGPMEKDKTDGLSLDIVRELGLEAEVIFFPEMRGDVLLLLSIMDVLTLPSYREGMPRLPMEAGAMGKPVVVTNIRGCREVVKDGETGLLVPARDSKALAEAILCLLQNEEVARGMGQAGRKRVEELFDERKVFQRIEAEYQRLLQTKGLVSAEVIEEETGEKRRAQTV